jgi:hypothetical protein
MVLIIKVLGFAFPQPNLLLLRNAILIIKVLGFAFPQPNLPALPALFALETDGCW